MLSAEADAMGGQGPESDYPRDLRAFQESDAPFFFGRNAFTSEFVATVERHRFVAVVGASGSGKSSIVQAGLIPALRQSGAWLVGIVHPGPESWRSLAACLYDLLEGEAGDGERTTRLVRKRLKRVVKLASDLKKGLDSGGVGLSHLVQAILARYPGRQRLLLLVDQWEELYTYTYGGKSGAPRTTGSITERAIPIAGLTS